MTVFIYEAITPELAREVVNQLRTLKSESEPVNIRIDSLGGSYRIGVRLWSLISKLPNPTTSFVDGMAASAAAIIAVASDRVLGHELSEGLIHSAIAGEGGNKEQLSETIEKLEEIDQKQSVIFGKKMKMPPTRVHALMKKGLPFGFKKGSELNFFDGEFKELPIAALYKLNNNMKIPTTIDEIKAWMKISKGEKLEASEQSLIQNEAFDVAAELLNEVEAEIKADAEAADGLDKLDATLVKKEDYLTKVKLFEASLDGLIAIAEKFPTEEKIEELANAKFEEKFNAFLAKLRSNQQVPTAENGFQTLKAEEGQKKQTFSTMDAQKASQEHFNNK